MHPELMSDMQARMCLPKTVHTAGCWRGASREWHGIMGIAMPHISVLPITNCATGAPHTTVQGTTEVLAATDKGSGGCLNARS